MPSTLISASEAEPKPQKTGRPSKDKLFTKQAAEYITKPRPCHDCGALTYDYRCSACRKKFNAKYGVYQSE